MNESAPVALALGVYVTLAVSVFGLPALQGATPMDPRLPFVGGLTIENVSWHVSGSLPARPTTTGVSSVVVALAALAVGAVLGWVTVSEAVPAGESAVPSLTV